MRNRGLPAGSLNDRIVLKRPTVTKSARGAMNGSGFTELGARRASVNYGRADERRRAGLDASEMAATFRVRSDSVTRSITAKDVLTHNGADWNITGVALFGAAIIDITAIRRI